jgi:hypothetical protein
MQRINSSAFLLLGLLICTGCGGSQSTVSGEVKVDGQPLKDGLIRFIPVDGKSGGVDATIADGKYKAIVPPGEMKVEIRGKKVVGKFRPMPESPEVEKVEELVDAAFNDKTELRYTVQSGSQEKNFDVKEAKGKK